MFFRKYIGLIYRLRGSPVSCQRSGLSKEHCDWPTVLVTNIAAARCVWSFGRIRRRGVESHWCIHAMSPFHVCRQVGCVTGVLDSHTTLFADYVSLVEFPLSLKKSKIMPNVRFVCVFWCIKYLLAVNFVLVPLHLRCVLSASVREGGNNGTFRVPRKHHWTRT